MSQNKSIDAATRERQAKEEVQRRQMEFQKALINFRKDWAMQVPELNEKKYIVDRVVGEGTYGLVQRGFDVKKQRKIAIKQMDIDPDKQGLPSVALREVAMLGELEHPNIVSVLDNLIGPRHLFVIFECLDMDLREYQNRYIKKEGKRLPFENVRDFTFQMLCGLEYVHERHFIHRDMKPQNVLIDIHHQHIKIADFGLARFFTAPLREMTNEVVTLWYRCPELLLGTDVYTSSVDIWSLGVMVIELVENHPPFDPDSEIRGLHLIFQALGTPDASLWADVENLKYFCEAFPKWPPKSWKAITPHSDEIIVDFIRDMLHYDPNKRPTCKQALNHPLFHPSSGFDPTTIYSHNLPPPANPTHPHSIPKLHRRIQRPPKPLPPLVRRFSNFEKARLDSDKRKQRLNMENNNNNSDSDSSESSKVQRKTPEQTDQFIAGLQKIAFGRLGVRKPPTTTTTFSQPTSNAKPTFASVAAGNKSLSQPSSSSSSHTKKQ